MCTKGTHCTSRKNLLISKIANNVQKTHNYMYIKLANVIKMHDIGLQANNIDN